MHQQQKAFLEMMESESEDDEEVKLEAADDNEEMLVEKGESSISPFKKILAPSAINVGML